MPVGGGVLGQAVFGELRLDEGVDRIPLRRRGGADEGFQGPGFVGARGEGEGAKQQERGLPEGRLPSRGGTKTESPGRRKNGERHFGGRWRASDDPGGIFLYSDLLI